MSNARIIEKLKNLTNGKKVPVRGLGDSLAVVLHNLGVPPCESCKKRQAMLNRMFPYKRNLFK